MRYLVVVVVGAWGAAASSSRSGSYRM